MSGRSTVAAADLADDSSPLSQIGDRADEIELVRVTVLAERIDLAPSRTRAATRLALSTFEPVPRSR